MLLSEFNYELPEELIAQTPLACRSDSRLLVLERDQKQALDKKFNDLPAFLQPGDLLIFNDTKVMPARMFGYRDSGGRIEVMIERLMSPQRAQARLKFSHAPKPGSHLIVADIRIEVINRDVDLFDLEISQGDFPSLMEKVGHMPLPPYIKRDDDEYDAQRYQTVYAQQPGAVAAPTAGLHFDDAMLARLKAQGIGMATVTLHVGAGTFLPVRTPNIHDHIMHKEWLEVDQRVCDAVAQTREAGGRVIAVGTTSVRSLETAAASGQLLPYSGETQLFITPGYEFKVADLLLTNFHLPESSLLMLVSAFSGKDRIMAAYQQAIEQKYRFFSYGDAMLLERT